jgi:hypothetical protein
MPGLVPGIHVLIYKKAWMAGSSPAMTSFETTGKYNHREDAQDIPSDAQNILIAFSRHPL